MARTEAAVVYWAMGQLKQRGFPAKADWLEGAILPEDIALRIKSKNSATNKGYIDIGGVVNNVLFIAEIKAPGKIKKAEIELRHYLKGLLGYAVIGWATDSKEEYWVFQSEKGQWMEYWGPRTLDGLCILSSHLKSLIAKPFNGSVHYVHKYSPFQKEKVTIQWEKGAGYVGCGHYIADVWVPRENKHRFEGKCPACKKQNDLKQALGNNRALIIRSKDSSDLILSGRLMAIKEVPTKSGVLSVHIQVGDQVCKAQGKKAKALLTWSIGSIVEIDGWQAGKSIHARHGKIVS